MGIFTDWDIVRNLLLALRWTLLLSFGALLGGGMVTVGLVLLRLKGGKALNGVIDGYRGIFQGTPLLMQLFLTFFGLTLFGINLSAWSAALLTLILYTSAYLLDIWFGSLRSIAVGQWQAARTLGLGFGETLLFIIVPQAMQIAIAPTVGMVVQVIKATALTSIIGFVELTKAGSVLANATLQPFKIYGLVALGYFLLCYPLSRLSVYLEKK